jgi:glycosyltransferase involved in cell wall biosynthesis
MINTAVLRFGGAVQVALSLIHQFRAFDNHQFHIALGSGVGKYIDPDEFPKNFHFYDKSFGVMGIRKLPAVSMEMTRLEKHITPDCVLTTTGPPYWRSRVPHLAGFNLPLYIYPETPYMQRLSPQRRLKIGARKQVHKRLFLRHADALVVQTDDVNQRVRKWLGINEVFTVTNTHRSFYLDPPPAQKRLPAKQPSVFRVLTVTSYYPHKNLEIIPKVIPLLSKQMSSPVEFVLTLSPDEFRAKISPDIPANLHLVGSVPPPGCPALYKECDAMFLPTLAECFSASYAEAMEMEKPIVTSDLGFARSICGPAAAYFAPADPRDAARAIVEVATSAAIQDRLRVTGRLRLQSFDTPVSRSEKKLGR